MGCIEVLGKNMKKESNIPVGNYVSRRGEHPSSIATALCDPNEGYRQRAVVLARSTGGMESVIRHYLSGIADHAAVRGVQNSEFVTPHQGAQGTLITASDILDFSRQPKWSSQDGEPFVRAGTWQLKLDSLSDVDGANEIFLRNISQELSENKFNKWSHPDKGGVAALPVIVIEIPGFDNEILDHVVKLITSVKGTEQYLEVVDTRSFDKEHLLEVLGKHFPDTTRAPLEKSATVKELMDKYHGSSELVLRIVSDAKRRPADEQGKCVVPLRDLFKEAKPQYEHLLDGGQGLA